MNTKTLNTLFLTALLFMAAQTICAQKNASDNSNARYGLGVASGLLKQGLYKTVKDKDGILWEQSIEVDHQTLEIIYRYSQVNAADSNRVWVYHIPAFDIDSMPSNWSDTTAFIFTRSKSIKHYLLPNDLDTIYTDNVKMYMLVGRIRNLTDRILNHTKEYKQYHIAARPSNAQGIVKEAVFNFIDKNKFNTADVRKLYVNEALYVGKCQLCDGVKKAFWQYLQTKTVTEPTDPDWEIGLTSPILDEQKIVMEKLVSVALQAYYTGNEMFTKEEVQQMKNKLSAERDRSMRMTNNKKCANCDGACKL